MRRVQLEGFRHICPICGKEFWGMADWAFKAGYNSAPVYLCSWKCLQKRRVIMAEKKKGKFKKAEVI